MTSKKFYLNIYASNPPESEVFHKSSEIYGLYEASQANRQIERLLVVEGYMDVVSLAQFGITYAVASMGTATNAESLSQLLKRCQNLVFCFDGDNAGVQAARKAMENALPLFQDGMQISFLLLPQGEDPDTMVRKIGKDAFEALMQQAMLLPEFLFDTLSSNHGSDKGALAKQAIALIEKVQDTVLQNLLLENLAHKLGMNSSEDLKKKLGFAVNKAKPLNAKGLQGRGTPLRLAIALLVQNPSLGFGLQKQPALERLQMPGIELLAHLLEMTREQSLNSAQLLELHREHEQKSTLTKLAQWDHQVADENVLPEFKQTLVWLNNQYIEQLYQELSLKQTLTKVEKIQLTKLIAIMKGIAK